MLGCEQLSVRQQQGKLHPVRCSRETMTPSDRDRRSIRSQLSEPFLTHLQHRSDPRNRSTRVVFARLLLCVTSGMLLDVLCFRLSL